MSEPNANLVFTMKPLEAIEHLTRQMVDQQFQLAAMRSQAASYPPEYVQELQAQIDQFASSLLNDYLPHMIVSLRLAHEILDTYGPEGITNAEQFDGSLWDNKYLVWLKELQG